jgi:hypothetical protein
MEMAELRDKDFLENIRIGHTDDWCMADKVTIDFTEALRPLC